MLKGGVRAGDEMYISFFRTSLIGLPGHPFLQSFFHRVFQRAVGRDFAVA
jgi:hypothetical protein